MALPRKLKNYNVFGDGESYLGQSKTVKLPVLTRLMEAYRGGGMAGPVKIDLGQDELVLEQTYGGLMRPILRQYGVTTHDGVQLRFAGSYQRDDTGGVDAVEIVVRGRHEEIDMGDAEVGEDTEFKVKTTCSYYKLTINGTTEIEIDLVNMIEIAGGVDRQQAHRLAIGV